MRLWSIHPKYLDTKGLLALWREGTYAQQVLAGKTSAYRNHPALNVFKAHTNTIGYYLSIILKEGHNRNYEFRPELITTPIEDCEGEVELDRLTLSFEWNHLLGKLASRNPKLCEQHMGLILEEIEPHPLFKVIEPEKYGIRNLKKG